MMRSFGNRSDCIVVDEPLYACYLAATGKPHPGAEEIVILQTGTSRVHLGDTVRDVAAGATVFIPPGTWISVDNIGKEPVSLIAIFSEPGYEEYMRAISVREGEKNSPLSKDELNAIRKQHPHAVIYE